MLFRRDFDYTHIVDIMFLAVADEYFLSLFCCFQCLALETTKTTTTPLNHLRDLPPPPPPPMRCALASGAPVSLGWAGAHVILPLLKRAMIRENMRQVCRALAGWLGGVAARYFRHFVRAIFVWRVNKHTQNQFAAIDSGGGSALAHARIRDKRRQRRRRRVCRREGGKTEEEWGGTRCSRRSNFFRNTRVRSATPETAGCESVWLVERALYHKCTTPLFARAWLAIHLFK